MSCRAWQDLLQRHLDGDDPPEALDLHLRDCGDCAAQRAALRRLLDALPLLRPVVPAVGMEERLIERLYSEARAQRRRLAWRRAWSLTGLAAAAALLLAVGLWSWGPIKGKVPDDSRVVSVSPQAPPLRESMSEAGQAVAALTSRTASDTVGRTTDLLPHLAGEALRPLTDPPAIEPPVQPLREAADGVSSGLAPVADLAQRAVHLFMRDLPMGHGDQPG
jgi:hypothetical protein